MADVIIEKIFNSEAFSWGGNDLVTAGSLRADYIAALRKADANSYEALIHFAKS